MKVNEIFYSIQGEGYHTGTSAIFIRLSVCNLKCPFCDTDFSQYTEMTDEEVVDRVCALSHKCKLVVITGGEPTVQDCTRLIDLLHQNGYYVAMESNGTRKPPFNLDWLTVSPKQPFVGATGEPKVHKASEVKVVFDGIHGISDFGIEAKHYYIQPCDTGNEAKNSQIINDCIVFIKNNPKWRLSLQTQKIINVR